MQANLTPTGLGAMEKIVWSGPSAGVSAPGVLMSKPSAESGAALT